MEQETFCCPICKKSSSDIDSLRKHCRKHKISSKELYIKLFCNGIEPTCACGCGTRTKFYTIQIGFSKYAPGHQSRVNNSWGHIKDSLEKSQKKRRHQIVSGEWKPWNLGQSKMTNKRVEAYCQVQNYHIENNASSALYQLCHDYVHENVCC